MTPARQPLDRAVIVAGALDLLDEVGLDRLSTRALADRLGVQSPALYWHFRSKADLVEAMAEAMIAGLGAVPEDLARRPSRASVAHWMVSRAQAFRRVLLSHRDGARVHAGTRPSDLGAVEAQLDALDRAGLDPIDAARATLAVSRFVVGWVLEEQQGTAGDAPVDLSGYPHLAAVRHVIDQGDPDATFDACLVAVVDGLVRNRPAAGSAPQRVPGRGGRHMVGTPR